MEGARRDGATATPPVMHHPKKKNEKAMVVVVMCCLRGEGRGGVVLIFRFTSRGVAGRRG
jgi:hypothetical protein